MAQSSGPEKNIRQAENLLSTLSDDKGKPRKGFVSRVWSAMGHLLFRNSKEDFEKKLQHLSKEEVAVHRRLKKRTQFWRKFARNLIIYSVLSEAIVLGVAIYSTRTTEMAWQTRAWRVLPVFALPLFTSLLYSSCARLHRMRERKDQRTLERLRMERQEQIDELKERTNYYLTQQLIQKYDVDPAAKAAAARVLASKLGSESGLKLALQAADALEKEDTDISFGRAPSSGQSNDVDTGVSSGLKHRRNSQKPNRAERPRYGQGNPQDRRMENVDRLLNKDMDLDGWERQQDMERQQQNMERQQQNMEYQQGKPWDGGWVARLAAMLVGEDPSQCYALVCGKCHMHNGLAKKEDFQYITYYCPHCHALNKSNHLEGDSKEQAAQGPAGASGGLRSGPAEEGFSTSGGTLSPAQDTALSDSAITSTDLISALVEESHPESERDTILEETPVQPHPM